MNEVVIGVDIGGTNTVFGMVDRNGTFVARGAIKTETHKDYSIFLGHLCDAIGEMIDKKPDDVQISGIGIGAPNGNYYNGTIEFAPNLNFFGVVPVVDFIRKRLHYDTVILTNDANAAAIGEMIYGSAKGMKDFIMITLGTGVGSGIVVNGEMVYGHDGFAGELGHVIAIPDGRECGCGRKGCLETYTSASGIKRTVLELIALRKDDSVLRNKSFNELSSKFIAEAAGRGDKIAIEAFEVTGKILGEKLADAVAYTSPEAIFLFGGLAKAGELIFKPVKKYFDMMLLNIYKDKVKILPSGLPPGDAAVLGAAALVWKELSPDY